MLEDDSEDMKAIEALQFRIEYQEVFLSKFSAFRSEMDSKVEYAKLKFDQLSERSDKLIKQFGCDPQRFLPKDLFQLLFEFAKDFSESYMKMLQKIKAEEERLKRLKKKAKEGRPTISGRATVCEDDPAVIKAEIEAFKAKLR